MKVAISEPESRTSVLKGDLRKGYDAFVHENGRREIAAPRWGGSAQKNCGSGLAREEGASVKITLSDTPFSRAGSLPQGMGVKPYLPGISVNRALPYTLSKFCGCIGRLMYWPLSHGSMLSR